MTTDKDTISRLKAEVRSLQKRLAAAPEPKERIVTKEVQVPGPVREKVVTKEVAVPGPVRERVVTKEMPVPDDAVLAENRRLRRTINQLSARLAEKKL